MNIMSDNNNSNGRDIIVITPNKSKKIPYFNAMRRFYGIPANKNIEIVRNNGDFSNDEFDALKNIIETGTTSKHELATFFANYLGVNKNFYNPTLPSSEVAQRKRPIASVSHVTVRKPAYISRNHFYNYPNYPNYNSIMNEEPTRKELLKNALMKVLAEERNNEAVVVENILGNRPNVVSLALEAKKNYSKASKSKRPSRTSRVTRKHASEKGNRERARKFARTYKKLMVNRN
jgi:hypothetical protein